MYDSDSDSRDSDEGIRFKTESVRNKKYKKDCDSDREKPSRSGSPKDYYRSRSTREKYKETRHKSRKRSSSHSSEERDKRRRHRETVKKISKQKEGHSLRNAEKRLDTEKCGGGKRKHNVTDQLKEINNPGDVVETEVFDIDNPKCVKSSTVDSIGPALPPHLLKDSQQCIGTEGCPDLEEDKAENNHILKTIGPALPPHMTNKQHEKGHYSEETVDTNEVKVIGPALPPSLLNQNQSTKSQNIIGPALPPHLADVHDNKTVGPALPPHFQQKAAIHTMDSDEDETYGPMPAGETKLTSVQLALEERALQLKMEQFDTEENKQPVREEWMLELPAAKAANFGLGPRTFRSKAGPDLSDRSSWTDTPEDKARKREGKIKPQQDLQKDAELKEVQRRDREQEKMSKKHKKHNKSLLEMHQKEQKKDKEMLGPGERKPFSRETDLQVNRFDESQKKAILKKAQLLDDRFSSGQSKFL